MKFKSYKHFETWLKKQTNKEFFITRTSSGNFSVVIARDNKLIIQTEKVRYWDRFPEGRAFKILEFINQ